MKKTLRFAALAGVLGLSFVSLQAKAMPPGVEPPPPPADAWGDGKTIQAPCRIYSTQGPAAPDRRVEADAARR
jgi:hypothetical protein